MEKTRLVVLLMIFLTSQFVSQVLSQSRGQIRYRSSPVEKCDRQGRCSPNDGYDEEVDDRYRSDKEKPAELARDRRPSAGEGRPGIAGDYNSKPPVSGDGYDLKDLAKGQDTKPDVDVARDKLKPITTSGGSRDYNPKPVSDRDLKPAISDSGGRDYKPKPVADRDDYEPRPVVVGGIEGGSGNYNTNRESYGSKPIVSSGTSGSYDSKPKSEVVSGSRGGNNVKPTEDSRSYDTNPVSDSAEYDVKPVRRGEASGGYNPKPSADREVYDAKPVVTGGGYNRKPIEDTRNYDTKPVSDRDEYDTKPVVSGGANRGYNGKPVADREVYDAKPVIAGAGGGNNRKPSPDRDDYNRRPSPDRDDYNRKPSPDRDDYNRKPSPDRDDYNRKPSPDRDDYNRKPSPDRDDYNRKPTRGNIEEYDPKSTADEEYKPPARGGSRGNNRRPSVSRDGYDPIPEDRDNTRTYDTKPLGDGGRDSSRRNPKPSNDRDEYLPKPDRGRYRPRPADDYDPRPVDDRPYRRPDRGDLGGYYDSKEEYDDDFDGYDVKDDYNRGTPASVKEHGKCICVPYYQCASGEIVTDGAGIIDARKRPDPDLDLPLDGKLPACGPFHVCCSNPETSTMVNYTHKCGVRNRFGVNNRILAPSNEGEADFGEWPWQAAVLKAEGKVNIFQCGGVLIDKYHVITVAHCVFHLYQYNEYPLKVRLGEWDTQMTTEFLAHADYKVAKILVHPEFRNTSLWNDIAILKLEEPVMFAPHIYSVCLPQYDESFAGQNCVVTGWGKDAYKGGTFSNVMKEVALEVIDNYKCEEMLRKTRLGRFFQLHEGFLCAGGEYGLDSCKGDGGGPLVCHRKDKSFALAGIVSWGIDCGQPGVPGVYVKIQKYLEWISKTTGVELADYWPKY